MNSEPFKIAKITVPGLFLLVLGLGNILVGSYKANQYQLVVSELSQMEEPSKLVNASLLKRIELDQAKSARIEDRREKATGRLDFYNLVSFGGKVMLSISGLLLSLGLLLRLVGNKEIPNTPAST